MTRETDTELVEPLSNPPSLTDKDNDLKARSDLCNSRRADVFVSVHNNANTNEEVQGTGTFYYDNLTIANPETSTEKYRLANNIQTNVRSLLGTQQFNKGVIADYEFNIDPETGEHFHFAVLRRAEQPAALVELAFMSNQEEFNLLGLEIFREAAATGIYNGIVDYLGVGSKIILDSDSDGLTNQNDKCPFENPGTLDSNRDGCIDTVDALVSETRAMNLQQGIANSLDTKLQNAQDALTASNAGKREDALNKLQAFINSVEAQRGKELSNEQADLLIAMTQNIMAVV